MSYDIDFRSHFTDLEISSGIPDIAYKDSLSSRINRKKALICREKRSEATRLLAGVKEKSKMLEILFRKISESDLDYMIMRYAKKENLPEQYLMLAKEKYCINILIRGFLKRVANIPATIKIITEIDELVATAKENISKEIVYDRVGKIQSFLHEKIDAAHGFPAHTGLPADHMRNLLSTCRLHLNLEEIKCKDTYYLLDIFRKSTLAAENESSNPSAAKILSEKKYIPYWRVRHMRGLQHYAHFKTRNTLKELMSVSNDLTTDKYRIELISSYSRNFLDI